MLFNEKSLALHETVEQMGYNSVEAFALVQARQQLLNEMALCVTNTEKFEKKYGTDYADLCKIFLQLGQSIFEKEEDSAEWNAELKQLNILQKALIPPCLMLSTVSSFSNRISSFKILLQENLSDLSKTKVSVEFIDGSVIFLREIII